MNSKVYDVLKYIGRIGLPAIAVFIKGLFDLWNIPYGVEISSTIMLVDVLLNSMLEISSANYQKEQALTGNQEK